MEFWGYKRKEGRAGIRNHVLILPTCACGSESCRVVAKQGNEYTSFDIHEALAMTKGLDPQTYTVMRTLTGVQ